MTTPLNVGKACNVTTLDQLTQDGLLLDLGERFEEWLRSLENPTTGPATNTSPTCKEENPPANFYLESSPGSDCQVSFEGVLHIEGHLAGNIRSFNGTLVIEQVQIEADIEVGVALINGRVNGNITASQRVVLQSQARVEGNINTPSLSISDGAIFEGECVFGDYGTETRPPAPMNKDEFCATSLVSA